MSRATPTRAARSSDSRLQPATASRVVTSTDQITTPPPNPRLTATPMAPAPDDTVGQLSFAPATQTTVVTTTTTTTTAFPPFVMQAPRHLRDRNPHDYPLASSPTPRAIKKLRFGLGGRTACFEEAENASHKLQEFANEQDALRASNGSLIASRVKANGRLHPSPLNAEPLRPLASPPVDVADHARSLPHDADTVEMDSFLRRNRHPHPQPATRRREIISESNTDEDEIPTSPFEPAHISASFAARTPTEELGEESLSRTNSAESRLTQTAAASGRPSAPVSIADQRVASNDASLPSPCLSPVTAAATLSRVPSQSRLRISRPTPTKGESQPVQCTSPVEEDEPAVEQGTLAQIPQMLDTFDQMPAEMKTYVIYQLLRRCPKPTLQFVATAVDPAMRCDFLGRLPLELSLHVLQYLDAPSMCRAAQVSHKWRHIVDTDERSWKSLVEAEGFEVSQAELKRAVAEGWAWQINGSATDLEEIAQNIPNDIQEHSAEAMDLVTPSKGLEDSPARSLKRKKPHRSAQYPADKRRKRRTAANASFEGLSSLEKKRGPHAYAMAAAAAVPQGIGLPRLRHVHFFKSIYQRHASMRRAWMGDGSKPKHFAFRAHDNRVVTCLQFDDDKIITGSDDCNIDIFDTKTGRVRNRLRGHEGGVWALEYHGDLLVSGSTDRTVRIWDLKEGRMLHVFQGHTSTVRCLQILQPTKIGETSSGKAIMMPRQPLIITGSRDSNCRVWRLPRADDPPYTEDPAGNASLNPYYVRTLQGHSNSVRAIAAHGDTLVSGSYDTFVRAWRISTGECIHRLQGHTSKVYSVVLDHERNRCISGSMDYMVKVWTLETGACLFNLSGHSSLVGLLDLSNDLLVSAAADATLRVWDPATGLCKHQLEGHTGAITCFLHDAQKIISGSDKTLKLWDIKTGECVRDLLTDLGSVWQIRFDERRCVAAVQRGEWTYIEVIDFGSCHEAGHPTLDHGGKRTTVDDKGLAIQEDDVGTLSEDGDGAADELADINALEPI